MLGGAEDAHDATQETFFAAYRNLKNFRGDAQVSSWLHRIAVNQCISRQRRSKTRPETPLPEIEETQADEQLRGKITSHASPAAAAEQNERATAVQRAVAALPMELREVVVLKEFEGLTFQQIADRLEIPLSTIKSRLYTALKQLRSKLEKFEAEIETK
jgi:RNA polymerase sigma-70 factor (ECF subfamily)